ncbi:MATE family efflux transporter [Streptomyces olivaceus]
MREDARLEFLGGRLGRKAWPDGTRGRVLQWLTRACVSQRPELWLDSQQGLVVERHREGRARPDGSLVASHAFAGAREWADPAPVLIVVEVTLANLVFTAAVAVGQATIPLISDRATKHDSTGVRRSVRAGTCLALSVVGLIAASVIVLSSWVVPLFTQDAGVRSQVTDLLPLVLAAVVTDALQAVVGFGLVGLKRPCPVSCRPPSATGRWPRPPLP